MVFILKLKKKRTHPNSWFWTSTLLSNSVNIRCWNVLYLQMNPKICVHNTTYPVQPSYTVGHSLTSKWHILSFRVNIFFIYLFFFKFKTTQTTLTLSVSTFSKLYTEYIKRRNGRIDIRPHRYEGWDFRDDCTELVYSVFLHSGFLAGQRA